MTVPNTIHNRFVHDEELIARLQRGDEWVHHLLVRRFQEQVFSTAFGMTLDGAEGQEITLEVFREAYRMIGRIQPDLTLSQWLQRLALIRCRNWKRCLRRRSRRRKAQGGHTAAEPMDMQGNASNPPETPLEGRAHRPRAEDILEQLPDPVRTAYVLRELVGLSHSAVAAVMGIKVGGVRSRLLNARRRIGKILCIELAASGKDAGGRLDPPCDEILIDRYLNGDLTVEEKARLKAHLSICDRCRRNVAGILQFSEELRERVRNAIASVDMVALEKRALTTNLRQPRSWRKLSGLLIVSGYFLLAGGILWLLFFYLFDGNP